MSTLDDAYKVAAEAMLRYEGIPDDVPVATVDIEATQTAIHAFLSYLADNPPEEMVEALDRWTFAHYEKQVFSDLPDAVCAALRSIGVDK